MFKERPEEGGNETSTEPLSSGPDEHVAPTQRGISVVVHYRDGVDVKQLMPGGVLVVGRSEPSDLRIPDRTLSGQHARFALTDGRIFVEDLGSRNGTFVAGKRIEGKTEIEAGAEVMLSTALARVIARGTAGDPRLEGEEAFRRSLEEEATRARHFRRTFAILAVRASEREAARAPTGAWTARLGPKLPPVHRLSLYTSDTALVLLPETGSESALKVAREVAAAAADKSAPYRVGVAVYREAASTVEEVRDLAREAASRATASDPVVRVSAAAWTESNVAGGEPIIAGAAMHEPIETAERVASSRLPVILHGETGTGKEVLAHFIHEKGPRCGQPFIAVNCGAIPAKLVESTLFGHLKGSFTGAVQHQQGVFEAANKGTLFLDEIGELPLAAQVALLRVLETKTFCRVGSTQQVPVDVRIIAATHRDLDAMMNEGRFREDLFYRLNAMVINLPALRDRRDEIEPLCRRFLKQANEAHGRSVRGISAKAMALLEAYRWPGNVRELRNAVERAVVLARTELIEPEDLPACVRAESSEEPSEKGVDSAPLRAKELMQQQEAQMLREALQKAGWNRAKAAKQLGMALRTLARKIKGFGLEPPEG